MSQIRVHSSQASYQINDSKPASTQRAQGASTEKANIAFSSDSYRSESPEKKKTLSISVNAGHMDKGGKHSGFMGIRTEKEIQVLGNEDSRLGLSVIGSHDLKLSQKTFHHTLGVGLKAEANLVNHPELNEHVSVYLSGEGTANVGVISGKTTAGVGLREAAGVQYNKFYAEAFAEQATNYSTQGLAVGARFHFDPKTNDNDSKPANWHISAEAGHMNKAGKHSGYTGVRAEKDYRIAGHGDSRVKLDAVGATEVKISGKTFDQSVGAGLKTTVRVTDDVNAYLSGEGTANIGAISGKFTAGVGLREAAGVEYKHYFAEAFAEQATNYNSQGLAVGGRFKF